MLNLDIKTRDEIVRVLPTLLVSAVVGQTLMQVVNILAGLKEVETKVVETKPEEPKK